MSSLSGEMQHAVPMLRYLVHRFGNNLQSVSLALLNLGDSSHAAAAGAEDLDRAKAHVAEFRAGLWMLSDLVDLIDQPDLPPEYVCRPFALLPLLADICTMFQVQALPVQLAPSDEVQALADRSRLTWVLAMLLRASLRRQRGAMLDPMVHVSAHRRDGRVCVSLADAGPQVALEQAWGECGAFCREVLRAGGGDLTMGEQGGMACLQLWLPLAEE
ncbi:HAMP domain-containing histidine kinase [Chloroflexia bacterium SDU3-3]|nr:HAMP domain-containing histidine kinase [Chloroflexia bacterium SDU3-3]